MNIGNIIKDGVKKVINHNKLRALLWSVLFEYRQKNNGYEHLLVSCFPKSGSTFTVQTISNITKYKEVFLAYSGEFNEQNIDLPKVLRCCEINTVTQQHLPATHSNINIINEFQLKNIVLVRNVFDVCLSIYDHWHHESIEGPACYVNEQFFELSELKKLDFIIDLVVPWYMKFYTSWYDAHLKNTSKFLFFTYEEILENELLFFKKIFKEWGLEYSDEDINKGILESKGQNNRLNKGVAGRGAVLSGEQKERINKLAAYYPWCDFSLIGIV